MQSLKDFRVLIKEGSPIPGQVEAFMPASFTALYNEKLANVVAGLITPEEAVDAWDRWYEQEYGE